MLNPCAASDGGRGGGRGGRDGGGGGGAAAAAPVRPAVPVPKEDFNFEEALSKFDKEKAVEVWPGLCHRQGQHCGLGFDLRFMGGAVAITI